MLQFQFLLNIVFGDFNYVMYISKYIVSFVWASKITVNKHYYISMQNTANNTGNGQLLLWPHVYSVYIVCIIKAEMYYDRNLVILPTWSLAFK